VTTRKEDNNMICHHHKCIFVHIPRTAGTSIESVFLRLLGLTRDTRAPLCLGDNDRPDKDPPHLEHLKADEYVRYKYLPQEMFDKYFKFSFVRNPWDRMVSFYNYFKFSRRCGFKSFVMDRFWNELLYNGYFWFVVPQCNFIYDEKGKLLVDYVGRYENLQEDFYEVCKNIGLSPLKLPEVNKAEVVTEPRLSLKRTREVVKRRKFKYLFEEFLYQYKEKYTPQYNKYQEYYDSESMEFVKDFYKKDIKMFGYTFDDN